MKDSNTGYKLIAAISLTAALFSCSVPSNGDNDVVIQMLRHIQLQQRDIDSKLASVSERITNIEGCSTEAFLNDDCADGELPNDVSAYTTFCISQGSGIDLSAGYAVSSVSSAQLGLGWGEVLEAEIAVELDFPVVVTPLGPIPPFYPLPSEISIAGDFGLSKGFDVCVDLPVEANSDQAEMVAQLVRDINVDASKYQRRYGRVLTYAETRTDSSLPIKPQRKIARNFTPQYNAENSFDIAEAAIDRFMSADFTGFSGNHGGEMFRDPIFIDLATSLELPQPLLDLIDDPFNPMAGLRPTGGLASACDNFGFTMELRNQYPGIDDVCGNIETLPSFNSITTAFNRIPNLPTAATVRNWICDNVTLGALAPDCD